LAEEADVSTLTLLAVKSADIAKAAQTVHAAVPAPAGVFQFPDHWPAQGELLVWSQQIGPGLAALLVLMGVVYLLFGYNIFKGLVILNAACLGGAIGYSIGDRYGGSIPLAFTCAFIFGVITYPLMKYAIVITGSVCGAAIGVSLWRTFELDPNFAWAGAGMGLIFFALLTFIVFRGCVMTYMALQGAAMLIFGLLALIFKYDGMPPRVHYCMHCKPFLLPLMIFIPTVLGVLFQNHQPSGPPPKK
jgi:hypothetical protein